VPDLCGLTIVSSAADCGTSACIKTTPPLLLVCRPDQNGTVVVQAGLRAVLENRGQVSEAEEQSINQHVATILHALHMAHGSKLSKLLAPARAALPTVDRIVASCCLPDT